MRRQGGEKTSWRRRWNLKDVDTMCEQRASWQAVFIGAIYDILLIKLQVGVCC
jgi:hypothetical protein